ncbi:MAG: Na+/H+ antiporter NhaA [Bacteroidota bacterium]
MIRSPMTLLRSQFQKFVALESSAGIVLLVCTVAALAWANSPFAASYHHLWQTEVGFSAGTWLLSKSIHHWINDGLMAIFFFVVGLEIKREILVGELASPRRALLPLAAAVGGMIVPAVIYVAFNNGTEGAPGWGIPMATDIAFSLGVLALLGSRAPFGLKVFLTAFAIIDDLGAVLIIALFYTSELSLTALWTVAGIVALLVVANWRGVRNPYLYGGLGVLLWMAFLESGVHATIAGVVLAMTIPARPKIDRARFLSESRDLVSAFENAAAGNQTLDGSQQAAVQALEERCEAVQSPMQRLEHGLHLWVSYFIMPVFALSNAGVSLIGEVRDAAFHPVTLGIVLGLFLGKQIGITLFAWLAVRFRLAAYPTGVTLRHIYGAALLGGIGFTMSLFIAALAFGDGPLLEYAKAGILVGSLVSGVFGWLIIRKIPLGQ